MESTGGVIVDRAITNVHAIGLNMITILLVVGDWTYFLIGTLILRPTTQGIARNYRAFLQ